ncbi:19476_t:CDS:2 [Funneliformis geosporum]|nr:19476_t:CDS:2 [Funneliformis geosporum]
MTVYWYEKVATFELLFNRSIRKEYLDGITILWYCYHNVMGLELQIRKALELELFQRAANLEK